jgi:hypothetical protein
MVPIKHIIILENEKPNCKKKHCRNSLIPSKITNSYTLRLMHAIEQRLRSQKKDHTQYHALRPSKAQSNILAHLTKSAKSPALHFNLLPKPTAQQKQLYRPLTKINTQRLAIRNHYHLELQNQVGKF